MTDKAAEVAASTVSDTHNPVELDNVAAGPVPPALAIEDDLMGLARLGELRAIQKLFDSGKYTASSTDEQGITALHVSQPPPCLHRLRYRH